MNDASIKGTVRAHLEPVVWAIGGIDTSGGAGITRDAITLADISVHACVLTTQVANQSHSIMRSATALSIDTLSEQWQALESDLPPKAIKIGAIANSAQALFLCEHMAKIKQYKNTGCFIVWDPVLVSSSGGVLSELSQQNIDALIAAVDIVTPNVKELAQITGRPVNCEKSLLAAAQALIARGAKAVYVKGGHAHWQSTATDTFVSTQAIRIFQQPRDNMGNLRGTGCMFASALAGFVASDYDIQDGLTLANAYLHKVRNASVFSSNSVCSADHIHCAGLVGFPLTPVHYPSVRYGDNDPIRHQTPMHFPRLTDTSLGIYPVVSDVSQLEILVKAGAAIIQLRIKFGSQEDKSIQIARAVEIVKDTPCQLFINDDWALAIEHGAYGVHLGQEDLETANLEAISRAGLRLGVSTHGYCELQRIKWLNPSYIALGHIFPTTTKDMPSKPQGLDRLSRYVRLCADIPTVAIGGINLSRINTVAGTGVSGIAVVRAVTQADDPAAAFHDLLRQMNDAEAIDNVSDSTIDDSINAAIDEPSTSVQHGLSYE
ncbi:thiamine phosphate synthase [Alteromonas sp. 1_MG-2023]|uniref:thiamine phosphate synthase n=1 Tax=Alteromonas sp. 1_MG-2023 TaxID=3062669 RepID=UPI0026E13192|nr:thiamine phosphate synthase [Alteromonas sp. 1_MG-2023]MDO6566561.1 thiamine phosphate synthase [Alteromonas sp. 1_MG-2023]